MSSISSIAPSASSAARSSRADEADTGRAVPDPSRTRRRTACRCSRHRGISIDAVQRSSGTVRLTATKHAVTSVVMPVLPRFLTLHQLPAHQVRRVPCVGIRGEGFQVRVDGPLVFYSDLLRASPLAGHGLALAYVYGDEVAADVMAGRLPRIFPGSYLIIQVGGKRLPPWRR